MTLLDRPVRSRTRPGRLAAIDAFLGPMPAGSRVIDFGFGEHCTTSLEWAAHLGPEVTLIAVERDAALVQAAQALGSRLQVICGGFDALPGLGPAAAVRVTSVPSW